VAIPVRRCNVTGRISRFFLFTIVLAAQPLLRAQEIIVPAGTILQCTLTEPSLSSKTVEVEDPILCDAGPIHEFGVSVFPRGAILGGRLAEYRDPGHFWGKGWMQLNFDRILLPGAEMAISTKVISAPKLKVDAHGKIRGRGHAGRDAVEWAIPVLWPEKVLTLPMRGPRPILKGESRITVKLMQDLSIPEGVEGLHSYRPQLRPGVFRTNPQIEPTRRPITSLAERAPQLWPSTIALTSRPSAEGSEPRLLSASQASGSDLPASEKITLLVLRDGRARVVTDYWFELGERIRYVSVDGSTGLLPIGSLDLKTTVKLNRERGVDFVIHEKEVDE